MPPKGKRGGKAGAETAAESGDVRVNLFDIDSGEADAYSFTETDDFGDTSKRSVGGKSGGSASNSRKLHSLSLNLQTKRALAERTSETRSAKPARQRFQLAPTAFNASPSGASTSATSRKRRALFDDDGDDDDDDADWRVPTSSNGAGHSHSNRTGSRNASLIRGGGMPRRFRKGAFLVNELDVDRERNEYSRVPLWRVEDAVSSLVRRYEPYSSDNMLYHRSTDAYRLTTGQENFYHLVQNIVFVKKDDNVLLYHVRDWPKLTGAPIDDDAGRSNGDEKVGESDGAADDNSTVNTDANATNDDANPDPTSTNTREDPAATAESTVEPK